MSQEILKVKMLGGFSLRYRGRELVLDRNAVSKTTCLLQLVLLHAENGISKSALADMLYSRDEVENRNGSLNNTIFRLRKQLKAAGLPESSYIRISAGMCQWDPAIPIEVDACEFEKRFCEARAEESQEIREGLNKKAWTVYTGEFLPNMAGEDWAAVESARYRSMYFACTGELCEQLQKEERYEELHQVAHQAAAIYPFDDWQLWEIDSLIGMARYHEGMEVYEKTAKMMFEELGISPSSAMLKRFRLMGERMSQASGAIEDIRRRLEEKESMPGAYFCTFPGFVDTYHVFVRMMERTGLSVFIMLCMLRDNKATPREQEREKKSSALAQAAIQRSLRKGDFYTRYNPSQYLIMLPGISQENCRLVSERIERAFRDLGGFAAGNQLDFYVASIAEVCSEPARES